MPAISGRVSGIHPSGRSGWELHFEALARKKAGEEITMLSVGDHDFDTPSQSVEACVQALRDGHHHYTELNGLPQLRRAMARVSAQSTGIETSADQVIATTGGQGALFAAVQATLDPGDHAIIAGPYYATYPGTFRLGNAEYTIVETKAEDDFLPDREMLETALTSRSKAVLINSPNNPTGAIYGPNTLGVLSEFCIANDLWLISDEVYWTHVRPGQKHLSPLALPGMQERTLVINSVSKSHGMTGWRVGWLRGPKDFIGELINLNLVVTYGLSDFVSHAVTEALNNAWGVEEIAARYARRRNAFIKEMSGSRRLAVRGSQGGMYVMLDVRDGFSSGDEFARLLLEKEKIAVMAGEGFGNSAVGHVRISLGQPEAVLVDSARQIRKLADNV